MSIFTLKRSNQEFAKWWDRWALRLQRSRVSNDQHEAEKNQKVNDPPYALQILKRFPYKYDL